MPDETTRDEMGGWHAPFVLLVLLLVALVAVASRLVLADPDRDVVVVGDSITVVSSAALHGELDRDNDVQIRANLGVTFEVMQPSAAELAATDPDAAVIELGSNDALLEVPFATTEAQIDRMVETFRAAGTECIVVVDVNTEMHRNDGKVVTAGATAINDHLAELATASDDIVVVGWDAALRDAEATGETLLPDTVHPEAPGARLLAVLVGEALEEHCDD